MDDSSGVLMRRRVRADAQGVVLRGDAISDDFPSDRHLPTPSTHPCRLSHLPPHILRPPIRHPFPYPLPYSHVRYPPRPGPRILRLQRSEHGDQVPPPGDPFGRDRRV